MGCGGTGISYGTVQRVLGDDCSTVMCCLGIEASDGWECRGGWRGEERCDEIYIKLLSLHSNKPISCFLGGGGGKE